MGCADREILVEGMRPYAMVYWTEFSPDGRYVLAGTWSPDVVLWDATTGQRVGAPLRNSDVTQIATFSPNGRLILTLSNDNTIRLWDVESALRHEPIKPQRWDYPEHNTTLSADGTMRIKDLVYPSDGLEIVDAQTEKLISTLNYHPLKGSQGIGNRGFSRDGERVLTIEGSSLTTGEGIAQLWSSKTGKPIGNPMHHPLGMEEAIFSHTGDRIATAAENGEARVWDGLTGNPITPSMLHDEAVLDIAFSPDGLLLATVCQNNTARLWDAGTGQPITPPFKHNANIDKVVFDQSKGDVIITHFANYNTQDYGTLGKPHLGLRQAAVTQTYDRLIAPDPINSSNRGDLGQPWDIRPDLRPLQQLIALAQIMAHHKIDNTGEIAPLSTDEMHKAWRIFRQYDKTD